MPIKKTSRRARASGQVKKLLEQSYSRVLVPDGGEHYAAEILEFPGCSSTGATPAEAYANLERAAEAWLVRWLGDGREAPRPFTNRETSGRFALRLPKSLYVRASQAAARESVSLNLYIANAVAERVGASAALSAFDGVVSELTKLAPRGVESASARRAGGSPAARARSERPVAAARA
ncbi:MAG TPA: toxin-antitoxin system HicB family antitoxin [Polyangiaceae bacterium]|nr:toxin-antitoxin system HicB family antitoxin [Polyangiaceae bacterium]